ncbi:MAG: S41 family peptidase [Acidobacteriota bacterium]
MTQRLSSTSSSRSFQPLNPARLPLLLCLIAALVLPLPARAEPWYQPQSLTPQQASEELTLVRRALERHHAGWERYLDLNERSDALGQLAAVTEGGTTDVELYLALSQLLAKVGCDHTKAEVPRPLADARQQLPTYLPFRVLVDDQRLVVVSATEDSGLAAGDEILALAGVPTPKLLATLRPLIPVDGTTYEVRDRELEQSGEFLRAGLDHFLPLLQGFSSSYEVTVRSSKAESSSPRQLTVAAVDGETFDALRPPSWQRARDFVDAVELQIVGAEDPRLAVGSDSPPKTAPKTVPKTALLTVETFVNYRRPANPLELYGEIFQQLHEAQVEHLIVDLRLNGGGSDDASLGLLGFLLDEPFRMMRSWRVKPLEFGDLKPYLNTWDSSVFQASAEDFQVLEDGWWQLPHELPFYDPLPTRFGGRLTVLSGPGNSSGSANILAQLQSRGRAQIVGEPTGGSSEGPTAGVLVFLRLPHSGITVRVPLRRQFNDLPTFQPGRGVDPDLLVEPTLEDRLEGRDPVLDAALRAWGTAPQSRSILPRL